jgi:phosphate transport system substrate-binding protein
MMQTRLLALAGSLALAAPAAAQVKLNGAGATFPNIIYQDWMITYNKAHADVQLNYQSIGSGGGIRQFSEGTVDFGGSDAPMSDSAIAAIQGNVLHIPTVLGAVVITYNLAGVTQALRVTPDLVADIFLGKVTKWSDPRIKAANPGASLPDQDITVVRRADSSGTTFVFTTHLAAVSEEWKKGPGVGTTVKWPSSDKFVASPKNDGVAATLRQTPGAIGYVEFAFAKFAKLEMATLQNKAGQFVAPGGKGGADALASVKLPADLRAWLPDPDAPQAYPIATYTWLLLYKKNADPKKAAALRELVDYCLTEGQKVSLQMGYIPLPETIASAVKKAASNVQ